MKKYLLFSSLILAGFLVLPFQAISQRVLFPACNATQPLRELSWLKAMVD